MFIIEDEIHAEPQGQFQDMDQAIFELRRRAQIPWNQEPNRAPCISWKTCGRVYEVIEYNDAVIPWEELRRIKVLEVSASNVRWAKGFGN